MNIEQRRRLYSTEVRNQISRLESQKIREENNLANLGKLNLPKEIHEKKKEELQTLLEKRNDDLESLKTRISAINAGKLDTEIEEESKAQRKVYEAKNAVAKKKKKDILEEDEDKKAKFDAKPREDNDEKYRKKDGIYFYKVFQRCDETLPDYMRTNLKEMPNNKGYIWRGCWFLGDKKAEKGQPMILFEKIKGGILLIHEYDSSEYRLFQKKGKDKKTLVSKKARLLRKQKGVK